MGKMMSIALCLVLLVAGIESCRRRPASPSPLEAAAAEYRAAKAQMDEQNARFNALLQKPRSVVRDGYADQRAEDIEAFKRLRRAEERLKAEAGR